MACSRSSAVPTYGLSAGDRALMDAFARALPPGWELVLEAGEPDETYARLVSPYCDPSLSAFLVEREAGVLILTDRLSDPYREELRSYASLPEALAEIALAISEPDVD